MFHFDYITKKGLKGPNTICIIILYHPERILIHGGSGLRKNKCIYYYLINHKP